MMTFESVDAESKFLACRYSLRGYTVKFVYEGHRVKVKVTAAKKLEIPYSLDVKCQSAITVVL